MKRILVTGGFGFIGGHLIEVLLKQGHAVHVVDNLSSNPIPVSCLLDELGHPSNLTSSICTVEEYCRYAPNAIFDEIYHLASPVGPAGVLKFAGRMVQQVVSDTYALMRLALRNEARLIDISTSEVYGGGQGGLCAETMPRIIQAEATIRLEYAVAKLAAEIALINTCKVEPLQAVIIRPFNVAGPRQSGKGGFVLPRFIDQAAHGQPLTVFGDGQQVRAFTHVRDIVDGVILVAERGQSGEVYNIGNPANKTTILDLANRVIGVIGTGSLSFVDGRSIYGPLYAEANDKFPDASKALALGWSPSRDMMTTIMDAWQYQTGRVIAR